MMPPRSASRRPARACLRTLRIVLRTNRVISGIIPIRAPLVHVLTHVEKPISIRQRRTDWLGRLAPAADISGTIEDRLVTPRVEILIQPAARRALPLGLSRKTARATTHFGQPLTISHRVEPAYSNHRLIRTRK